MDITVMLYRLYNQLKGILLLAQSKYWFKGLGSSTVMGSVTIVLDKIK